MRSLCSKEDCQGNHYLLADPNGVRKVCVIPSEKSLRELDELKKKLGLEGMENVRC